MYLLLDTTCIAILAERAQSSFTRRLLSQHAALPRNPSGSITINSRMQVLNPVASTSQSGLHRPTCEGASKRSLRYHLFGAKTKCFQASERAVQNLSIAN